MFKAKSRYFPFAFGLVFYQKQYWEHSLINLINTICAKEDPEYISKMYFIDQKNWQAGDASSIPAL